MRMRIVIPATLLAAAVSLAAQAPAPQNPPDQQRQTFRREANYVRVDVFPTRAGAPLKGLSAADFEVLEDGVPQTIDNFEFVQVTGNIAQEHRQEPNTIQESREALRNPRARVFVLFLDVPHVTIDGTWHVREPLVRLIDRILAPDDLVGIMIPMMAASDIVFARKTDVVAGGLRDKWPWGERHTLAEDEREFMYKACYPYPETADVVKEMIARRRERTTLDSLDELVAWLRNERDERKAVLTISEGWWLFRRNSDLTRPRQLESGGTEPVPGPEPIGTGPDGRIRIGHAMSSSGDPISKTECDRDRQYLSQIDNEQYFRDLIDKANRANASFYTVDPRGLPVFDSPIGPEPPPPPSVDFEILRHRIDTLRTLADNTDGLAVVNSNDIDKGLRRMADDLTSYYLLGYYSTNTKLDGRFRKITVRVKQPDVDVRARRGYKAATEEEVMAARSAAEAPPVPEGVSAAQKAIANLARTRPDAKLRTRAIVAGGEQPGVWVAGELASPAAAAASADVSVSAADATASATVPLAAGQRAFVVRVPLTAVPADPLDVRVRVPQAGYVPLTDMVRLEPAAGLPQPLMYRRGPSTGNRVQPAGEASFSRTERARFDLPVHGDTKIAAARLLDRNATPLELPVAVAERTDDEGQRWVSAEIVLAPLGAGDYVIEFSGTGAGGAQKLVTAFRVTR